MAQFAFREPPENGNTESLRLYLRALIEDLEYVLNNIDEENMTSEFLKRLDTEGREGS